MKTLRFTMMMMMMMMGSIASVQLPAVAQEPPPEKWVSAYLTAWSFHNYNPDLYYTDTTIPWNTLTHVIHFACGVDGSYKKVSTSQIFITAAQGGWDEDPLKLTAAAHAHGKRAILCIGGSGDYNLVFGIQPAHRAALIQDIIATMLKYKYDGLDIDLEMGSTGGWGMTSSDIPHYKDFIRDLRTEMNKHQAFYDPAKKPELSAAIAWNFDVFVELEPYFDQINLMSYEMTGAWHLKSWYTQAIYSRNPDGSVFALSGDNSPVEMTSVQSMVRDYLSRGGSRAKLGAGFSTYGSIISGGQLATDPSQGISEPYQRWNGLYSGTGVPNHHSWDFDRRQLKNMYGEFIVPFSGQHRRDEKAKVSWIKIFSNDGNPANESLVSWPSAQDAREWVKFIKSENLGGGIVFDLGASLLPKTEPDRNPWMTAIGSEMFGGTPPPPPADTQAPTCSITAPAGGATVSGSLNVSASASDNVGVSRVEFKVDGTLKSTDTSSPYGFSLDTTAYPNGVHTISAQAFDAVGLSSTSSVSMTVSNAPVGGSGGGDLTIYDDVLASGWSNVGWNTTVNFTGTSPVYSGTNAALVTVNSAWGGFSLKRSTSITNPSSYSAVEFYAHGGSASETFYVLLEQAGSSSGFTQINAGATTVNAWKKFSIPMASLNPSNLAFDRIHIQSNIAGSYSVDACRLVKTGDATAPVVAITGPTSNPTYATSASSITLAGTASDNVGVTSVTSSHGTVTGTTSWSNVVSLVSGTNVITITARDAAGNSSTDTLTVTRTDATPPTLAIGSTATVTLQGTASDAVGISSVTFANAANGATGTASGTTSWTASVPVVAGSNSITITVRDAAGNAAFKVVTLNVTLP